MQKYCCTNCGYVYNPFIGDIEQEIESGTFFEDIKDDYYCPNCGENKDNFYGITENIQEVEDLENISDEEEMHIPFFYEKDDKIFVKIGSEDNFINQEEKHFIEYVGIFDDSGDLVDIKKFPDIEKEIVFDIGDLDYYEIRSSCNLHGIWKGIKRLTD